MNINFRNLSEIFVGAMSKLKTQIKYTILATIINLIAEYMLLPSFEPVVVMYLTEN